MAHCTRRKLIVPNDVANSVIAQVIMATMSGCTNARMPDECPSMRACLTAAQIATITSWIPRRRADVTRGRRVDAGYLQAVKSMPSQS